MLNRLIDRTWLFRLGAIAVAVGLCVASAQALYAPQDPCPQTHFENIESDSLHYLPGDTVTVTGKGFATACSVGITVNLPGGVEDQAGLRFVTTDGAGNFSYALVLGALTGDYSVQAVTSDGISMGTAPFTSGIFVVADKPEYKPGETAKFSGRGFAPGETVLLLVEQMYPTPHSYQRWLSAIADGTGALLSGDFTLQEFDRDTTLSVTAIGQASGRSAQTKFADATFGFVQKRTNQTTQTDVTSLTSTAYSPAPIQGNLLVAVVGTFGPATISMTSLGWTQDINETGAAGVPGQAIFHKIAGASESTSVQVGLTGATFSSTGSYSFNSAAKTITGSGFLVAGFGVGQSITTTSPTNPGPFTISAVTATLMTLSAGDTINTAAAASTTITGVGTTATITTYEFSGVLSSSDPGDGTASTTGTGTTVSASAASLTPTSGASTDLLFAGLTANGGSTTLTYTIASITNGFTVRAATGTVNGGGAAAGNNQRIASQSADRTNSSANNTTSMPIGTSSQWRGQIAAFKAKSDTTTAVTTSGPSVVGQSVTVTATVTATPGSGSGTAPIGGTADVKDGAAVICDDATVTAGVASCNVPFTLGSHSLTAVYSGDGSYNGSTSPAFSQVVTIAGTSTAVVSNRNPALFPDLVTFTATVSAAGSITPTGNVAFKDGGTNISSCASVALSGGVATCTPSTALAIGSHSITVVYAGTTSFSTSTSPTLTQVVNSTPSCPFTVDVSGVATNAYVSIQGAVNALPNPGPCTINIKAGTYNETVLLVASTKNNSAATLESQRIVIQRDPSAPVGSVIVNAANVPGLNAFEFGGAKFVTLKGLDITGADRAGIVLGGSPTNSNITIDSNIIHDNSPGGGVTGGIDVNASNSNTWIVNNLIRDNGRDNLALANGVTNAYIVNNTIVGAGWNGVNWVSSATNTAFLVNNLIVGNGTAAGGTGGRFGVTHTNTAVATGLTLVNNVIYGNIGGDFSSPAADLLDPTDSGNRTTTGSGLGNGDPKTFSATFVAATKTITRSVGSYVTDGFEVGHTITTTNGSNPGPFTITVVAAGTITVAETVVNAGPASTTFTDTTGIAGCTFADCLGTHTFNEIFVDTAANNFHLKTAAPISPATDKGVNNYGIPERVPTVDFEGSSRPADGDGVLGAQVDAGYDEAGPAITDHTVTFDGNGATAGSMSPQTASAPTALTTNTFTRTGYTFAGWNTVAGGGGTAYADGASYAFTADVTLYAQWTAVSQTLTFESNGGSAVTAITQDFGTSVSAPAAPTRTGYSFGGWYTDNGTFLSAYTFPHTMGLSTTIYAKWTAVSQTLTFESNGGTAVTAITQDFGSSVSAPAAPTRTGYSFGGWFTDDGTFLSAYTFPHTMGLSTTIYAKWTAVSQTLTFESNGGSAVSPITQDFGSSVSAPAAPTRTGYSFGGWFTDDGTFLSAYTFPHTMGLSTTIYAKWTAVSQTLTFESNGGTAVSPITQDFGTSVSAPADPTRTGYTFGGWFTDNGTFLSAYTFPHTMGLSTTIYAKWTAVSQTLTFESNGGTAVSPITQDFGTSVSAPANPTRTGYTFGGWFTDNGTFLSAYTFPHTMGLSTTIYAKWTAVSQTLTFESNGGTAVSPITQDFGSSVSAPANPTRTGYTFSGWFTDDGTFLAAYTFPHTMGLSTTIYAKWTANGETLTFESNGGTAVSPITQDFGTSVSAPANPTRTGYSFAGWFTDNGTFLNAYTFPHTMGLSTTIYAKWTANGETLTFESNGGTAVSPITQDFGTSVSAPANPTRTGYAFGGWFIDDGTFLSAYTFPHTMGLSTTIYAKWTANGETLTFESNGGTAVSPITQDFGSSVSAPANPTRTGYTFGGWFTDNGTFLAAYTFPHTMGLSTTIYAKWTANGETLTFESNGGTAVSPITQDFGSSVSAPANPTRTGYTFSGWFTDDGTFLTAYTFPHTMGLSTTIYAKWTAVSQTLTFESNGGSAVSPITQDFGSSVSAPAAPTRTGYSFGGWFTDDGTFLSAYTFPHTMGLSTTIYAKWTAVSQTLTFESNGGTAVSPITQDFGTSVSAPANPTRTGYTFGGWFTDNGTFLAAYTFPHTMGLSTTIYAKWTAVSQTLTFESNGGTAVSPITQDFGSSVSAPANPTRSGYTFGGWFTDDGTFLSAYTFPHTMGLSTTIYAKWTLTQSNGSLKVTKVVTGVPGGGFFMASFTVHVECTAGGPYADKVITYPFPGNVTYTDIPAGATCTVTEITKSAPPGGYLWGPETITPTPSLPIPAGGTAYATVTNPMAPAPAPPTPGLGITKTANKTTVTFGESVTYAYVVKNTGGVTLTDVVVVDDNGTPLFAGDDVTVGTIASLAPGASQTFTRTLVPPAPVCGKDYGGQTGSCGQLLTEHRSDGTTKFTYLQARDGRDGYSGSGGWSGKRSYAQQTQFRVWNKNGTYTDVNTTLGAGDGSNYFNSFSFVVNKSSVADANGSVKLPGIFHKNGWNRDWHLDWDKLYGDPTRQKYWDTVAPSWDKYTDRKPCSGDVTNTVKVTAKAGATTLTASDTETVTVK